MTPTIPIVLNGVAHLLMMELAPRLGGAYVAYGAQLGGMLAMMAAQEFDRAAARLVEENAAIASLLADGCALVDGARRAALDAALAAGEPSLLVSALQARNRTLRAALEQLHAHLETLDGTAARALELRIWDELAASTRRRQLDLALPS